MIVDAKLINLNLKRTISSRTTILLAHMRVMMMRSSTFKFNLAMKQKCRMQKTRANMMICSCRGKKAIELLTPI